MIEDIYVNELKKVCEALTLDDFPQVQARDLLYKTITLNDVYFPIRLRSYSLTDRIRRDFRSIQTVLPIATSILTTPLEENTLSAPHLFLSGAPGGGKTTFCKRLALAYLNKEIDFFEEQEALTGISFVRECLPVMLTFRNADSIKTMLSKHCDFSELLYQSTCNYIGPNLKSLISKQDFIHMIDSKQKENRLCFIVDGWDGLLDIELQKQLDSILTGYVNQNPHASVIFTLGIGAKLPLLLSILFHEWNAQSLFYIDPFSNDDITQFCKKWYEIIYKHDEAKQMQHKTVANHIISALSKDIDIAFMARKPLALSQLLTLSRYSGRLPENASDLYENLLDLYVSRITNIKDSCITSNSMRILLAYIATYLTKNDKSQCTLKELETVVKQCYIDLSGSFSETITDDDIPTIITLLEHSVLFGKHGKDSYGFELYRAFQEYLTAYAIITQTADSEYNDRMPIEIFQDKYTSPSWLKVIHYAVLMKDNRLNRQIVKDLMDNLPHSTESCDYANLLFQFIIEGVAINSDCKFRIYDYLFEDSLNAQHIEYIYELLLQKNKTSEEFSEYISNKFAESVSGRTLSYGNAHAASSAALSIIQGNSPLADAEEYLFSEDTYTILTGLLILSLLGWYKYIPIASCSPAFLPFLRAYHTSEKSIHRLLELWNTFDKAVVTESIKNCILADFFTFEEFINQQQYDKLLCELDSENEYCEAILSLAPLTGSALSCKHSFSESIKSKYRKRLEAEIENNDYESVIFTFSLCVIINVWDESEKEQQWNRIKEFYEKNFSNPIAKRRYNQVKEYW